MVDASVISQAPVMAAIITADQPDPDASNNTSCQILKQTDPFVVDLAVQVQAKVGVNEEATFIITVRNTGPDTGSGIQVQAVFPEELGYTGSLLSHGAYDRKTGLWSIGILKNKELAEILVNVAPLVDSGQAVLQAFLSKAAEGEINQADNADSADVVIVNTAEGGHGSGGCYLSTIF